MVIVNKFIPFKGFLAMNFFGLIFARKEHWEKCDENKKKSCINHEKIHTRQLLETGIIFFYPLYLIEFFYNLLFSGNPDTAYYNISFEKEAFEHDEDFEYLKNRKPFAMWRK